MKAIRWSTICYRDVAKEQTDQNGRFRYKLALTSKYRGRVATEVLV